mmetsp:Transcript_11004/g.15480  ORF Transcript_11004/g.15480 Transcript_11004/m.15480 type:complete len:170 (+) Transcript_11004:85-594(+)
MGVAVAYPRIPTKSAGSTSLVQFLACAIAAAVVGPPTFALLARYNSVSLRRKTSFPKVIKVMKCTHICMHEKRNSDGADLSTSWMDPAAPDAAKNICMNSMPMDVPVSLIFEKKLGYRVAAATVTSDTDGRAEVPGGRKMLVNTLPMERRQDVAVKENAMDVIVILESC